MKGSSMGNCRIWKFPKCILVLNSTSKFVAFLAKNRSELVYKNNPWGKKSFKSYKE